MDQTQISVISPFFHCRCDSEKKWKMKNEKEFFYIHIPSSDLVSVDNESSHKETIKYL